MDYTRTRCKHCHEYITKDVFNRWVHAVNEDRWAFGCDQCSWKGTPKGERDRYGFDCPMCGSKVSRLDHMADLDDKWL